MDLPVEVWSTGTRRRPCVWGAWGFLPTQVKLGALFVAIDEEYFDQLTQPLVCLHPRPGRSRRMAESRSRYTYSAHPGTSITRSRPTGPGRSGAAQTAVSELHPPNAKNIPRKVQRVYRLPLSTPPLTRPTHFMFFVHVSPLRDLSSFPLSPSPALSSSPSFSPPALPLPPSPSPPPPLVHHVLPRLSASNGTNNQKQQQQQQQQNTPACLCSCRRR